MAVKKALMKSLIVIKRKVTLYDSDVEILDGSINRAVRCVWEEDEEVKRLYKLYKEL